MIETKNGEVAVEDRRNEGITFAEALAEQYPLFFKRDFIERWFRANEDLPPTPDLQFQYVTDLRLGKDYTYWNGESYRNALGIGHDEGRLVLMRNDSILLSGEFNQIGFDYTDGNFEQMLVHTREIQDKSDSAYVSFYGISGSEVTPLVQGADAVEKLSDVLGGYLVFGAVKGDRTTISYSSLTGRTLNSFTTEYPVSLERTQILDWSDDYSDVVWKTYIDSSHQALFRNGDLIVRGKGDVYGNRDRSVAFLQTSEGQGIRAIRDGETVWEDRSVNLSSSVANTDLTIAVAFASVDSGTRRAIILSPNKVDISSVKPFLAGSEKFEVIDKQIRIRCFRNSILRTIILTPQALETTPEITEVETAA